ncbi:BQ5605_C014g07472 [Microbotryum silenes-dioicae]|uniref:Pre-mRNA-processing protein 45 n=1 Tax=Microbotryum silenes-dioicae TaxID=796604 RepID=A0A2X0LY95_9BASI|nr:BQ5605_C014g07472 [Microbotryum silenes-dioicae]
MATLLSSLPAPRHLVNADGDDADDVAKVPGAQGSSSSSVLTTTARVIPAYGQRKGWRPTQMTDFGDGGSYPECHVAQYPLEMGRKSKSNSGNTLALQVDADGNVRYDAIAQQGHRDGRLVQSSFKDLIPMVNRTDIKVRDMERPSEEEVQTTADRTKAALEKLVQGKIKAAQPKNVPNSQGKLARLVSFGGGGVLVLIRTRLASAGEISFMRYTPQQGDGTQQRIIKMTEVVEDPLEPPRFKGKKIPRGPPSPPPPVLRSPPRKVTAQDQKDWMIPPCVSNWKNNKGFTIPLDKRLAADGRGLQDVLINDRFAQFSEALYIADRHAREEVRQRSLMQQKIAQKEKEAKEEHLRMLAQRAREERSGIVSSHAPARVVAGAEGGSMPSALAGYGSDSDSDANSTTQSPPPRRIAADERSGEDSASEGESEGDENETEEDRRAAKEREQIRRERKKEREREMRMSNMGTEQRAKVLARSVYSYSLTYSRKMLTGDRSLIPHRATGRDISEKIALGLAKPTLSKEAMLDSRLFNQEQLNTSFGDDDSYNIYDKPLFSGSSAAAAIYRPRGANIDDEGNDVSLEDGISKSMQNDRFGLGVAGRGFQGSDLAEVRDGPVAFEKDTADPFGVDAFLETAKAGNPKRGLDVKDDAARKRARD